MKPDFKSILELEKNNEGNIYFSIGDNNLFVCFELSAYILNQIYPFIQLHKDISGRKAIIKAFFDEKLCAKDFVGDNVEIGNEGIKVNLDHYSNEMRKKWMNEFKKYKKSL